MPDKIFFPFTARKLNGSFLKAAEQVSMTAPSIAGRKIRTVCEIGAGFGAMAEIILSATRPDRYIIIDLPETLRISWGYLSSVASVGATDNTWPNNPSLAPVVLGGTEVLFVDATSLENHNLSDVDLFINSNSFGEMDHTALNFYLTLVNSAPGALLVSANRARREGDHLFDPLTFTSDFPDWHLLLAATQQIHKSYQRNLVTVHEVRRPAHDKMADGAA